MSTFDHLMTQTTTRWECTCGKTFKREHTHAVAVMKRGETVAYVHIGSDKVVTYK